MRQLFTWRFLAAVAALAGLALLVNAVVADDDQLTAVVAPEVLDRRVDLIASVFYAERSDDFEVGDDGLSVGFVDFTLANRRVMRVAPGTAVDIDCNLNALNRCVVFADLLGDAVIWVGVREQAERETVELPPIVDLEDGYALFENGWQIKYAPIIDRVCEGEDVVSFSDFLRRFGPGSVSVVDVETQIVVQVRCAGNEAPDIAPTTTEAVDLPDVVGGDVPVVTLDENVVGGALDENLPADSGTTTTSPNDE